MLSDGERGWRIGRDMRRGIPLKRVFTVAKYDPIGITIMPRVKARSFMMTDLGAGVSGRRGEVNMKRGLRTWELREQCRTLHGLLGWSQCCRPFQEWTSLGR